MSDVEYQLVTKKSVIPCVDLVLLRGQELWEVALFIRSTGYEKGKWCIIGGRQQKGEVANDMIKRQVAEMEVEVEVIAPFEPNFPAWQYDDPNQDQTKHATDSVYPVKIVSGEIKNQGKEYAHYQWFAIDQLPTDNWAYHHKIEVQKAIEQLKKFGVDLID